MQQTTVSDTQEWSCGSVVPTTLHCTGRVREHEVTFEAVLLHAGGAFDPMGFSKDSSKLESMKLKEVKNGRLAMLAFIGFIAQHEVTGKGPLQNLADHLGNPGGVNFATNGTSLPPFAFPFLF
jgi:hypothetical protein